MQNGAAQQWLTLVYLSLAPMVLGWLILASGRNEPTFIFGSYALLIIGLVMLGAAVINIARLACEVLDYQHWKMKQEQSVAQTLSTDA